eukprot:1438293-Rhodomonas_salina.1
MESSGLPGKIQCTKRAAELLLKQDAGFEVELRGEVEVKGKGKMTTYFLNAYSPHRPRPAFPALSLPTSLGIDGGVLARRSSSGVPTNSASEVASSG